MKKEYDFSKAKKRSKRVKAEKDTAKMPTSMRLDESVLAWFKTEAQRQGIPYQTIVSSVLHRFANGELVDEAEVKKIHKMKSVG